MERKELYSLEYMEKHLRPYVLGKQIPEQLNVGNGTRLRQIRLIINEHNDAIKPYSQRYELFYKKCMTCVTCGAEANMWALEKSEGHESYHLNLYRITPGEPDLLFTKDHIVAKKNGGKNHIDNYQTMCKTCNEAKGHMDNEAFQKQMEEL